jgi:hypothetical protein
VYATLERLEENWDLDTETGYAIQKPVAKTAM